MHRQELLRERAVLADQRRQVTEEEQVHAVAVRVGVEKPKDRLDQQEGIKCVFAPMRREPHRLRHVGGPVREARELAPNEPTENQDPHRHTERPMQVNECNSLILGRCEIDREGEYNDRGDEEQGQPVQNRITGSKTRSSGSPSVRSIRIPHSHGLVGSAGGEIELRAGLFPRPPHARAEFCGERMAWPRESAERYAGYR